MTDEEKKKDQIDKTIEDHKNPMEQKNKKKEMGLEERFAAIELILDQMEDENVTLDESFELYKKGMEQMKAANQALDQIEKAMLVMNESGELEEF